MLKASEVFAQSPSPLKEERFPTWRRRDLIVPQAGSVAVFECGKQDAQAPVALLVHGLGHWSQGAWDGMAALLGSTHRVIAFDLPGFGESEKPDVRYDLPFFIATMHGVVEALALRRFILVGHSLGGMIAADYAGTYPEEIEMLALIAPAGFLRTPKIFVRIVAGEPVSRFFSLKPSRRFVHGLLEQTFYDQTLITEEMYERAFELSQDPNVCRAFLRVYAGALRDFLDMPGFHARLARYSGPTLLVLGRQDQFIPMRALANARKVYPHADVLLLDRCGHSPNVEMPAPVVHRMISGPTPRAIYSREFTAVQYAVPSPYPQTKPASEFINGQLILKANAPWLRANARGAIVSALRTWAAERGSGRVGAEWAFDVTPPGELVNRVIPDAAYLSYDRIGYSDDAAAALPAMAPNAAFEVLAPGQKIEDFAEKVRILLAAGCELAAVIDPQAEYAVLYDRMQVQRIDGNHRLAHRALPGFSVQLSALFEKPKPKTP